MIKLLQGNCLDIMKRMTDNFVDLVITDPPYKINHTTGGTKNIGLNNKWQGNIKAGNTIMGFDTNIRFFDWIPEIYRILKPSGHLYVFCNDKNMQELLNVSTKVGFKESNILVWIKNNATPNKYYMKNCEFVVLFYKDKAKPINEMGSKSAIYCKNINGKVKLHPVEKPVDLIQMFVNNSSKKDEIVFDPFMGSGSTGVACVNINRSFIGIELDEKYFSISKNRIYNILNKEF